MEFPRELFADVGLRASMAFIARLAARFERLAIVEQSYWQLRDPYENDLIIDAAWSFARGLPQPSAFRDLEQHTVAVHRDQAMEGNSQFFDRLMAQTAQAVRLSYDAAWVYPPPEQAIVITIDAIAEIFALAVSGSSNVIQDEIAHDIEVLCRLTSHGRVKIGGQVEPGQIGPFGPLWNIIDITGLVPLPKLRPYLVIEASEPLIPEEILLRRTESEGAENDAIWILYFARNENSIQVNNIIHSARLYHDSKSIHNLRDRNSASTQKIVHSDPYFVLYVSDVVSDDINEFRDYLLRDSIMLITGNEILSSRRIDDNTQRLKSSLPRDLTSLKLWFENELNTIGIARDRGGEGEVMTLLRRPDRFHRDLSATYRTQIRTNQPS